MVLGADASTTRDLTALVGVADNLETHTKDVVYCRVWRPESGEYRFGKPTVDLDETIKREIMRLYLEGRVQGVYYDPYQLHSIGLELEKEGVKMVELPQTNMRVEADQALYDAIIGKNLRHYNDPVLNEHIKNAVAIETPRGFRLAKEKTSRKIDASVALSMAHYGAINNKITWWMS
jgi:phage terminase large subunit-like protein